ncbi:F-box/kelch-repeat protein At5g43190 [Cajanus cajan]|uniref:F-box/kelch-repeat protein At5g43190 family n=1 Tax=Cajanus cajan TaxID=3821 RepID=A0A151TTM4_CAJCA|nr:F-box/kelch-repeat protein At5g43190 [Cajanus cajan]KYP70413.1 F-box/kelch-repeat protein At5g43190 family [Cajanus cajan]
MDPRIWSKLPRDVVEHILLLLPLKTLLNLRPTCKAFTSLLFSPSFISKHSSSSSPFSSFLLLSHPHCPHHFLLYDSKLCAWRSFFLSLSRSLPFSSSFTLVSSSGGLFCLYDPSSSSFLVSNLFVKSYRKIESPTRLAHFSFFTTPLGYNIVLLSSNNTVFVYDSNELSWRCFQGFNAILSYSYHQQGAFFDGGLYFTTPEPFSVVRLDLERGKWERHVAELPHRHQLTFVRLVSDGDQGKLYLLGGVGNDGISRSITLWEMMGERGVWVEVARLPEIVCRKFVSVCYHNYDHVYCFWHEGMVCVCCYMWPEMLCYSVLRMSWDWLPKCPYLPLKGSCGFNWFSFVPRLYASV